MTDKLWAQACNNEERLLQCKLHKFGSFADVPLPLPLRFKFTCERCGGAMGAVQALRYAQGFEAAGGDPNRIIEGFK